MFCKKGVLRNFIKFTGKHLCQNLFFDTVADLRPATLLKNRLWHRCFPVNFSKFLRTPFLIVHLRWLLLDKGEMDFNITSVANCASEEYVERERVFADTDDESNSKFLP